MSKFVVAVVGFMSFMVLPAYGKVCEGFGPQTPRDITQKDGTNSVVFDFAPAYEQMNLCNIHFHKNAEHKGPEFSVSGGDGEFGGFKCNSTKSLTEAQLKSPPVKGCENVAPGETIEIHWVHTSCNVKPGPGLGSCLSDACANPQLRVETQVYVLANDPKGINMMDLDVQKKKKGDYYQATSIPTGNDAVQYLGSTTGPSFSEEKCSPLQVTWNVNPTCQVMDIGSVHRWCKTNQFDEKKAHGGRKLVTNKKLLSEIN